MITKAKARTFRLKPEEALADGVTSEGIARARMAIHAERQAAMTVFDHVLAPEPANSAPPPPLQHSQQSAPAQEATTPHSAAPQAAALAQTAPAQATESDQESDIAAVRSEGLTGRQLRLARRLAQRNGIAATSDYDAVRQLRARGIDPFQRGAILELMPTDTPRSEETGTALVPQEYLTPHSNLPATVPEVPPLGPLQESASQIYDIQRDIARRRQQKLMALFRRLAVFVLLPTIIAGWYYNVVATPMYATESEFVIQIASSVAPGADLSAQAQGMALATLQDSATVQSYLQSRDALQLLDEELGFKAHYQQPWISYLQRLAPDATNEDTFALYEKKVKVGFDPMEGVLKMEVIAADPDTSQAFSEALFRYAEAQVDHLTERMRVDQMSGAMQSYETAEANVLVAQMRVLDLQEKLGILDPVSETGSIMSQITTFELQLSERNLELQQHLANSRPNQARVQALQGEVARLQSLINDMRSTMTQTVSGEASLARVTGELRIAEGDLATRQLLLQGAAQQLETARIEANRQVRYMAMGVRPIAPDEPTYPRAIANTLLAFAIFAGIYLMISLTVSVLREQVSS